ncbi:hypothetical protein V1525DRAFT_425082 [Lipomyces kononenkoae]|uniref:Uncharacterized protein n=1 Tax=Lipomyces kononenkoae TaxID=34357 RepID=A0ACC3T4M4_LIPKO
MTTNSSPKEECIYYGADTSRSRVRPLVEASIVTTRGVKPSVATSEIKDDFERRTSVVRSCVQEQSMSRQMSTTTNEQNSYERALRFLRANRPEGRLDVHLSYKFFQALESQAKAIYGNAKYPRVEYSAIDSRVTIHTIPTALHSSAAGSFERHISICVRDVLVQHGRESLFNLLVSVADTTCESVDDYGRGSTKSPDNRLMYRRIGQLSDLILVIEFHCPTAILLWCKENRRFRYPINPDVYSVSDRPGFEEALRQTELADPFGPYLYRDHSWFGTMERAIIEVYKRVRDGRRIVTEERLDLGLSLGDFYPPSEQGIEDIRESPILPATEYLTFVLTTGGCTEHGKEQIYQIYT